MSKKKIDDTLLNRVLSISALVIGLFSLYFAWKANEISSQSIKPIVTILDVGTIGSVYPQGGGVQHTDGNFTYVSPGVYCIYAIRITNLGGASTAIIGKTLKIFFKGAEYKVNSDFEIANENLDNEFFGHFRSETITYEAMVSLNRYNDLKTDDFISYPHELANYKTEDLYERVLFDWKKPSDFLDFLSVGMTEHGGFELTPEFFPLDISFEYKLSNGDIASTPPSTCVFIKAP